MSDDRLAQIRERLEARPPAQWWSQAQAREDVAYLIQRVDELTKALASTLTHLRRHHKDESCPVVQGAERVLAGESWAEITEDDDG